MYQYSDFIKFESGVDEIGIDHFDENKILLIDKKIKSEYINSCRPAKQVFHNSFYILKKLVSAESFDKFVTSTGYITESEVDGWGWIWNKKWEKRHGVSWREPFKGKADEVYRENMHIFPVMQISWNDAMAYAAWISSSGNILNLRLPYEYEWEIFAKNSGISSLDLVDNNSEYLIYDSLKFVNDIFIKCQETGFQFGLLWEWTMNWYKGYENIIKNKDFGEVYKVLRGGSLLSSSVQKSREFRFRRCPTARSPYYGFRLVFEEM